MIDISNCGRGFECKRTSVISSENTPEKRNTDRAFK